MNKVAINMAKIGKSNESKEGAGFAKYIGIAPFFIVAVNPTLDKLKELYPGRNFDKAPDYKYINKDNPSDTGIYVTFHLKSNPEHKESIGVELTHSVRFLIKGSINSNKDKTKYQVINDYGDTVWVTPEDFKAKNYPDYASTYPLESMRPAYVGEADLIETIKCFLGIAGSRNYSKDAGWSTKTGDDLDAALCAFDKEDIQAMLTGNMSAVEDMINQQSDNQIKYLCGVRTTEDGKEYQEIWTRTPIRFGTTDYKKIDVKLAEEKEAGRLANSNFGVFPFNFRKYEVNMSSFSQSNTSTPTPSTEEDPFAEFGVAPETSKF